MNWRASMATHLSGGPVAAIRARAFSSRCRYATGMWRIEDDEGQAAPRGLVPAAALEG